MPLRYNHRPRPSLDTHGPPTHQDLYSNRRHWAGHWAEGPRDLLRTLGRADCDHLTMGHRLTKIYTRTGDTGETGLGDGTRVGKDSLRVCALGEVDELNSLIGLLLAEQLPGGARAALVRIQHDLFDLGGEVCIPGHASMNEAQVAQLETLLDEYNATLPPLKEFILPGGTRAAGLAHLARTVCRRAERALISLARAEPVGTAARIYLNRLSDLLFVLGRVLNREGGGSDVLWQRVTTPEKDAGKGDK